MKEIIALVVAIALLYVTNVYAHRYSLEEEDRWTTANVTCGEWSAARIKDDDRQLIVEAWINGFLTASGYYRTNTDAMQHPDFIVGIDHYCRSNPDVPLVQAVRQQVKR
jgi:hypothetical protein